MISGLCFASASKSYAQSVQEWSEPINLSMSGAAIDPSIVVDINGGIHVIWIDEYDGFKYAQSEDGLTWTTPETVDFPFSTDSPPPLLLSDAEGTIHIFWLSDRSNLSYAQSLPESLDSPSNWTARTDLDSSSYDFDVNLDAQGGLHVVYLRNPNSPADTTPTDLIPPSGTAGAFYRRSADGGRAWDASTLLYESPYFRSLDAENAHIRVAVSDSAEEERVYAVWDDRPQKRIFFATSTDGGLNWASTKEMVAPQEELGYQTPYNADIDVLNDKVLATWFVGEPGVRCVPYSWSSSDGGDTWGEQSPILPGSAQCPEKSEFISIDPDYSVELFTIQGELSLSAWNGVVWSNPEVQTGPSQVTNPATFEPVLLGCEKTSIHDDQLLVVGCDEGAGGDIWFLARQLEPLENLFPLPSQWSGDANVTSTPRTITSLSSIADSAGNAHAIWVESPLITTDAFAPIILYSRWNGADWLRPTPIITDLDGLPLNLSLQIDSQQRLLLTWVNQQTGELMFTWSNSERANVPLEWIKPIILSASSKLTDSPDILVDATDRIVIAYAITLNEERGIYIIQSTDLGETWSSPVKIFDAVLEEWEMVNQPKLSVTADGTLHVLFTQYALTGQPQPIGLYYSYSSDGGVTWSAAETVSNQPVQWSEIVTYQDTIHRIWQEQSKSFARAHHQFSSDFGKTWGAPATIPTGSDINARPDISVDGEGGLHYVQVSGQDSQMFEEWEWKDLRWQSVETRNIAALELNDPPYVESGINAGGSLYALLHFEKLLNDGIETDIWSISRSLEVNESASPLMATISTPSTSSVVVATPDLEPTLVPTSALAGLSDPQPGISRNTVGLILVVLVVLSIVVFAVPRRRKTQ